LLSEYRLHHFEEAAKIRIQKYAPIRCNGDGLRCLDIGIGWGVVWRNFAKYNQVFGMDFSLGMLMILQDLFKASGMNIEVICASVDAIPFRSDSFNYIFSTQVYQHVPHLKTVRSSFEKISQILTDGGTYVCENLNYYPFFWKYVSGFLRKRGKRGLPIQLIGMLNSRGKLGFNQIIADRPDFFLRTFRPKEYKLLFDAFDHVKVMASEIFFHPEYYYFTNNRTLAKIDNLLGLFPLSKLFSRQLTAVCHK